MRVVLSLLALAVVGGFIIGCGGPPDEPEPLIQGQKPDPGYKGDLNKAGGQETPTVN